MTNKEIIEASVNAIERHCLSYGSPARDFLVNVIKGLLEQKDKKCKERMIEALGSMPIFSEEEKDDISDQAWRMRLKQVYWQQEQINKLK